MFDDAMKMVLPKNSRMFCFSYSIFGQEENKKDSREYIVEGSPEPTASMYADRMNRWDHEKYKQAKINAFGNESDYFDERTLEQIESFLNHYTGRSITLYSVVVSENRSSGYPIYCFRYSEG